MSMVASLCQAQVIELAVGEGYYLYTPTPEYPYTAIMHASWDTSEAPNMGFSSIPDNYSAHAGIRNAFSGTQKISCTFVWYRISDRGGRVASPPMTKTWYFKCKGGGNSSGSGTVTSGELHIVPETLELEEGEERVMSCWATGLSGSVADTWSSSNSSVATVERTDFYTAKVKAKSAGQCTISVTSGGLTATCQLTVKEVKPSGITVDAANFPDENFRTCLLINYSNYCEDRVLTNEEIININGLYIDQQNIRSLKGIELLTALTELSCNNNQLTSLDLSKNTALIKLSCGRNQLKSLDLSKNTALTELVCNTNQLSALNLSKNTALTEVYCGNNQLTNLNLFKNTKLTHLWCDDNKLSTLDVSKNIALENLDCCENTLISLDVSKNHALERLLCRGNQLTSIDVSNNIKLSTLDCRDNQLNSLDITKNTELQYLYCDENGISGRAMDALISGLNNSIRYKEIFVIRVNSNKERNVCTKTQVTTAKQKGWSVQYHNGLVYEDYEGSDDTTTPETGGARMYCHTANSNLVTYDDGATMQITGNTSKSYGKGGANIAVDGTTYASIKNFNGAQNTFTAAEGNKIYRVNFYAVPNVDGDAPKLTEFAGATVSQDITTVKNGANPTKIVMCINGASSVTFTFSEKQVNFIMEVDYSETSYDAQYDPTGNNTGEPTTKYNITLPVMQTVAVGETIQLTPIIEPASTEAILTWSTDDASIAKVTSKGVVMGIKEGTAIITVMTDNGLSADCFVTVQSATGISDVGADSEDAPFYTLSGQRLAAPRKGLNILGGKKIIVK